MPSTPEHQQHHETIDHAQLDRLTPNMLEGLACVRCGRSGGSQRAIDTPDNPHSTHVFVHVDADDCVRFDPRAAVARLKMLHASDLIDDRARTHVDDVLHMLGVRAARQVARDDS